eukprot:c21901_g1_i1 orf=466-1638(-)
MRDFVTLYRELVNDWWPVCFGHRCTRSEGMVHLSFGTMTDHSSPSSFSSSSPSFSHSSSSSPSSTPSFSPLDVAVIPFLWEKKPGVSKEPMEMKKKIQPVILHTDFSGKRRAVKVSSTDTGDSVHPNILPLPPPPCLQQPSQHAASGCPRDSIFSVNSKDHIGAFSESFTARRPRKLKAKDDPFLLALEVCTKEDNDGSDPSNIISKVVTKTGRKKSTYNPLLIQEKEVVRKTVSTYSFKAESFESEEPDTSTDSEASGINGDSSHISERGIQLKSSVSGSNKVRRLRSSRCGRDNSRDLYKNLPIQVPKELLYGSHSPVSAKSHSGSTRKQCHPVRLSCGQHRKVTFSASKGNKQTFQDWFGCRSAEESFNGVIDPSTKCLRIVSRTIC